MVAQPSQGPLLAIDWLTISIVRQFVKNWRIDFSIHRVGDVQSRPEVVRDVAGEEVIQYILEYLEELGAHHGQVEWSSDQPVLSYDGVSPFDGF